MLWRFEQGLLGCRGVQSGHRPRPRRRPMAEMPRATAAGAGWPPDQGLAFRPTPCRAAGGRCWRLWWAQLWESVGHTDASVPAQCLQRCCGGGGMGGWRPGFAGCQPSSKLLGV